MAKRAQGPGAGCKRTARSVRRRKQVRAVRLENFFWSRAHQAIVAKVFDGQSVKVCHPLELVNEPGKLFTDFLARRLAAEEGEEEGAPRRVLTARTLIRAPGAQTECSSGAACPDSAPDRVQTGGQLRGALRAPGARRLAEEEGAPRRVHFERQGPRQSATRGPGAQTERNSGAACPDSAPDGVQTGGQAAPWQSARRGPGAQTECEPGAGLGVLGVVARSYESGGESGPDGAVLVPFPFSSPPLS